ncbi:MAG: DUF2089 domain-containing protein [Ignavibacteria bacterium]
MPYKLLNECPVCSSKLKIIKLSCDTCNTIIESEFSFSTFESLNEEQIKFAIIFIKNRGSIKEIEKEMGISYPTVRAKLDDVVKSLEYSVKSDKENSAEEIINKLQKGEIDPDEALSKIKNI